MPNQRVTTLTTANILDHCARLLELAEGEAGHAYYNGYVRGYLARAAEALRAGDTRTLEAQATALRGEVAKVQAQANQGEPYRGEAAAGPHAFTGPLDGKCLTCGQPSGALAHEAYRRREPSERFEA
jgi:hypothetical protein